MGNLGPMMNGVDWMLTGLSGIVLSLRICCKFIRHRGLWWDDHVLITAWICLLIGCSFLSRAITLGFVDPDASLTDDVVIQLDVIGGVMNIFFTLAIGLSKTSFGLTLLRITDGWTQRAIRTLIILMDLLFLLYILFQYFQCSPAVYSWIKGDGCLSITTYITFAMFVGAFSAVADLTFAVVPWFLIMHLQMRMKEKIGVSVAMSFGVIAGITAIMRCINMPKLESPNFRTSGTTLAIWYVAEAATTITAASLPILRALIDDVRISAERSSFSRSTQHKTMAWAEHLSVDSISLSQKSSYYDSSDSASGRDILEGPPKYGESLQTHEAHPNWPERNDKENMVYEMNDMYRGVDGP